MNIKISPRLLRRNFVDTSSYIKNHYRRITYGKVFHADSAVIIGCHEVEKNGIKFTQVGDTVNSRCHGRLAELLQISEFKGKIGEARVFHGVDKDFPCIAVAGLGKFDAKDDENEGLDSCKENVRLGIGAAAKALQNIEMKTVEVDPCSQYAVAAEVMQLSTFIFDDFKSETKKNKAKRMQFGLLKTSESNKENLLDWSEGCVTGDCQNFARWLMETPSNYKFPVRFAQIVQDRLSQLGNVSVEVRDKSWAEQMKMGCFLSVAQGSTQPPVFLEIKYTHADDQPIVLVGKGVTFDTGGISIKPSNNMSLMKGDMGGAACVVASLEAVARLKMPVNLVALVPLTENMPSASAAKPGDVFTAMNGKTVEVDNTDAEGRMILADALCYAHQFNPSTIIDVATLTGAIDVALGAGAAGAYSTSNDLWRILYESGKTTGDRLWRMPIFKYYSKEMDCSSTADLRNTQKKARSAGSPTAAAFLKEFVEIDRWAHLDIAGVMTNQGEIPYLGNGMSGRPTRTLIETVKRLISRER